MTMWMCHLQIVIIIIIIIIIIRWLTAVRRRTLLASCCCECRFIGKEACQDDRVQVCLLSYLLKELSRTRLFRSPKGIGKKFEIAGFRNNRGSVKGKGKSKGIRPSFEIAGTSN